MNVARGLVDDRFKSQLLALQFRTPIGGDLVRLTFVRPTLLPPTPARVELWTSDFLSTGSIWTNLGATDIKYQWLDQHAEFVLRAQDNPQNRFG